MPRLSRYHFRLATQSSNEPQASNQDPVATPQPAQLPRRLARLGWRGSIRELLVVFVGVLMALAADSAYSTWQDRKLEQYYLEQLRVDLQSDTAQLALTGRLLQVKEEGLAVLQASFGNGDASLLDSTVVRAMIQAEALHWSIPPLRTTTFRELNSTGRLALLRDPMLRAEIIGYYGWQDAEAVRTESRRTGYGPAVYALIPPNVRGHIDYDRLIAAGAARRRPSRADLVRPAGAEVERAMRTTVVEARRAGFEKHVNAESAFAEYLHSRQRRMSVRMFGLLARLEAERQRAAGEPK